MRLLEIFTILTAIPALIFMLLPASNRPKTLAMNGFVLLPLALALAQVLTGEFHWQMVPAYAVILLMVLLRLPYLVNPRRAAGQRGLLSVSASLLGLAALVLAGLLTTLFPLFNLPDTFGPYFIGTEALFFPGEAADFPGYMVQVWYPIEADVPSHTTYFDHPERAAAFGRVYGLPFLFSHANLVGTNSHPDTTIYTEGGPYPVILLSHAAQRSRFNNSIVTESLANFGYVVFAPDHPVDALDIVYPDGRVLEQGSPVEDVAGALSARVDDLLFIWEQVQTLNDSGPFAGALDLTRLAVVGDSIGGAAALTFCGQVEACQAAVNLDGNPISPGDETPWWGEDIESLGTIPAVLVMHQASVLPSPEQVPEILSLIAPSVTAQQYFGQPIALYRYLEATSARNVWLRIDGTVHAHFSDETLWAPFLMPRRAAAIISDYIEPEQGRSIVRDFTVIFLNAVLQEDEEATFMQRGIDALVELHEISSGDIDALAAALSP